MKKKKSNKKTLELPKIYRFITEKVSSISKNKTVVVSIYSLLYLIMVAVTVYLSVNIYKNLTIYQKVSSEQATIISQIKSWQGIIKDYPNFKDAYLQIAVLEYRLKNYERSKEFCNKALLLDPEYSDAIELSKKLEGNN
jgi:tetratricopeptide (TPR) repeat protein